MEGTNLADSMVFVVDDDRSVRVAVERLLRSAGLEVETLESAREFLEREPVDVPCCLVLDVRMPELTGLDLQQAMQQADVDIPIVFITGHGDVPTSVRAMKGGAVDFLQKPFEGRDLLDAIHAALERDRRARAVRIEVATIDRRAQALTPREREVFGLVARGLPNKQIALELGAAEKTIKVHRGRVMQKMQADSLADLVRMAGKLGIEAE